ncbi:hypothetical protein [Cohnella yongneupensis]|uniref:Restriction endonuclease n=1 Tax=Cohnella yongneupensis TaxID=425006 RepID=A0ABW0QUC7_9BACL
MSWSTDDSRNLERIADALERISAFQERQAIVPPNFEELLKEVSTDNLEADFFSRVTRVYAEEGQLVQQRGGGKKSSKRVASEFSEIYPAFFAEHVPGVTVKAVKSGLLIVRREDKPVCGLKIYTDLGYGSRGEQWYENMNYFVQLASEYDVSSDRMFFLVVSFRNGLDNEHVQKVLGVKISNKDLLEADNHNYLEQYAKGWVEGAKNNPLPNPQQQCFFLATKLHPNVIEEVLAEDLSGYEWFRPSVTELINTIKSTALASK